MCPIEISLISQYDIFLAFSRPAPAMNVKQTPSSVCKISPYQPLHTILNRFTCSVHRTRPCERDVTIEMKPYYTEITLIRT